MLNYSRRQVAASFLALLGCGFRLDAQCAAGEPTRSSSTASGNSAENPQRAKARKYRADILLFGMTIYRRVAVGDGEASMDESGEGANLHRTLSFATGSDPNRVRGVSRLGDARDRGGP